MQESRDLKTMNKAHGKVVDDKAGTFLPEHVAPEWPPMLVESKLSGEEEFSRPAPGINARVVLGSFRAAAEMYLSEWRNVVRDTFGDQEDVELVELAVCDVGVGFSPPCDFLSRTMMHVHGPHSFQCYLSSSKRFGQVILSQTHSHIAGNEDVAIQGILDECIQGQGRQENDEDACEARAPLW